MLRDCCGVFLYVWWRTRGAMSSRHEGMRKVGGHYKKARWCFQGVQGMTGVYLLNPLAKERKAYGNMATFSSHQRWKIFQQRWKLDGRKKCHYWILTSMNILSVAFLYQMEQTDSEYLWPCSSWEGDVCLMSLWISCSRRCSSPGSESFHSHDTAECCPPSTVLEIQFGKWKIFLWSVTSDPNYSDLSPKSSRHFVFRSILPFPVCSGGPASTHSSEHGCSSAPAAWEKWRFRHWTNTAINCNCLVHPAFWYNLNPFYQMQISGFLSGALNSIFCAHSLSFAIHKVLVAVGWHNSTPVILALKGKLPTQIWQ